MHLTQLSLTQFKNYEKSVFQFSPFVNILFGKNGAGKTNVLDAIYYLSVTKSYFNHIDHQQIMQGNQFFVVDGLVNKDKIEESIKIVFQKGQGKSLLVNNNAVDKFSSHIGAFPVVMVAPGDIQLIQEGSEERRKFMDLLLSQCNSLYLYELMQYNKVLDQRNKLLRDFAYHSYINRELLEVYNSQLSQLGTNIYYARAKFMEEFKPLFLSNYKQLSGGDEFVEIMYESDLHMQPFGNLLQNYEQADFDLQRTTKGIHRDDLQFMLQNNPIKKFGSQGQQKSFIIAIKLAQFAYLKEKLNLTPVLLLDDIFEKLDQTRLQQLFEWIAAEKFGQIIITDTQEERSRQAFLGSNLPIAFFSINSGIVHPV